MDTNYEDVQIDDKDEEEVCIILQSMFNIFDILIQDFTEGMREKIEAIAGEDYFQLRAQAILEAIIDDKIPYVAVQFEKTPAPQNNSHWGMQNGE